MKKRPLLNLIPEWGKQVWQRLRKRYLTRLAAYFLVVLTGIAVFADMIANDRPYYARYNGESHFPILTPLKVDSVWNYRTGKFQLFAYNTADWRSLPLEKVVWAPVPYSPERLDPHNRKPVPPGTEQYYETYWGEERLLPLRLEHWLGTYTNGQDVLAGLIHGARVSLTVGIFSMLIATMIGLLLGSLAGYFGDTRLRASRGRYLMAFVSLFLVYFYGFYVRRYNLAAAGEEGGWTLLLAFAISLGLSLLIIIGGQGLGKLLARISAYWGEPIAIPVDWWVSRIIEVLRSVPVILVIISFSVIFGGSVVFVILIIGLTSWPGIARLIRAEFLRIVNLDYMEAARALGYHERRMIFKHALPNGIAPVLVTLSFGIAGAIMVESTLSFLNIGVGPETVTWGTLLRKGKSNFDMWWLTVFPGLLIFLTVLAFNLQGEHLRDILDPRNNMEGKL